MNKGKIIICLGVFILVLSACITSEIDNNLPGGQTSITSTTGDPTPSSPTITPKFEEPAKSFIPDGIMSIGQGTDGIRLTVLDSQLTDEWQFPGYFYGPISPTNNNRFHYGSYTRDGLVDAAIIYLSNLFGDPEIVFHQGKSGVISLQNISELINMVGVPRQPYVAFSDLDTESVQIFNNTRFQSPSDSNGESTTVPPVINSWLYVGSLETLPVDQAILTRSDENGYVIYPLAVAMEGEELSGVWYTLKYKGLIGGGPIFFIGFNGLYYFDLETELIDEVLSPEFQTLALSNNQTYAAYKDTSTEEQPVVAIQNLANGIISGIDVLPDTNSTGVGDAHFSPSGIYLAWLEYYLGDDNISSVIRVASASGEELKRIDTRDLINGITEKDINTITLAGWIDDARLVVEVHSSPDTDLYILNIIDMSMTYLVPGNFIGFTYP